VSGRSSPCLFAAGKAHTEEPRSRAGPLSQPAAAGVWVLTQLVPSPLLVCRIESRGGGLSLASDPRRVFVRRRRSSISRVCRGSGSRDTPARIELYLSPEWGVLRFKRRDELESHRAWARDFICRSSATVNRWRRR